jgi:HEAT repeat protein
MDAAKDTLITTLIKEVQTFGADRIVMPFDIMNLAYRISEHPERTAALSNLVAWMDHPSNFTRHIATRALQLMGPEVLTDAVVGKALLIVCCDDAANVRAEAIRLLGRSGRRDAAVLAALSTTAASDDTDYVRNQAREVLDAVMAVGGKLAGAT